MKAIGQSTFERLHSQSEEEWTKEQKDKLKNYMPSFYCILHHSYIQFWSNQQHYFREDFFIALITGVETKYDY